MIKGILKKIKEHSENISVYSVLLHTTYIPKRASHIVILAKLRVFLFL